jgi:hypothetical protein
MTFFFFSFAMQLSSETRYFIAVVFDFTTKEPKVVSGRNKS